MSINQLYASFLINAANVYASQQSTSFKAEESWFEKRLMALFEQAKKSDVETRDIALIASTALAVILTKPARPDKTSKGIHQGRLMEILRMAENEALDFPVNRQAGLQLYREPLLCRMRFCRK